MNIARTAPVTLIGGAPFAADDLKTALFHAPTVVAADGGADAALALGVMPDAVFGDFDSIEAQRSIPADRLHHIAEQDSTDFEKCLSRIAAPVVLAVGFAGARQDHFLAALSVMARRVGPPCILMTGDDVITLCPPRLTLDLTPGTRVSLFPMGQARGQSTGLHWPIDGLEMAPCGRIGTSNQATGPVTLVIDGAMLLILPKACLAILISALAGLE